MFIVMALCTITLAAQETAIPSQEETAKKKEINNIKLSEQAVYADVMQIATDDNEAVSLAQQKSINMLQAHVIEIFAKRMHMEKKDVQEIWDVIDDKCQNIVVRKGDLFRVFTYIMKDAIGLGPKKPKEGDVEKYLKPDSTETHVATTDTAALKDVAFQLTHTLTGGKDSIDNTALPAAQAVPATTAATAPAQTTTAPVQTATTPAQAAAPVQAATAVPVAASAPAPAPVAVAIPNLAQNMMSKANMTELMRYLSKEKRNQKLMFGNFNTMQYPAKCYVVVIDKASKGIVAVLDKGQKERMNFTTRQMDNLNNYKGGKYAAILVQEY